ncbi:hypothetical protein CMQ_2892 [Grosmannia clavigera kw1407]|uniref:Uncharacterized protein n=1 Tax=Grosmannia clavigera (strain kw1407 / UAMH 11150) TaxID=655863 RepID=F0XGC5_GROCL|nr:uncharacterized protein CMQ_2892 [Grosmannia clavigera kw1407]EFX02963.1 hypothetical protein CMQ_2892 [Grosmannia clavigera kw1407]
MCQAIGFNAKCRVCRLNRAISFHHYDLCTPAQKTGDVCEIAAKAAHDLGPFTLICDSCKHSLDRLERYRGHDCRVIGVPAEESKRQIETWLEQLKKEEPNNENLYTAARDQAEENNELLLQQEFHPTKNTTPPEGLIFYNIREQHQKQKQQDRLSGEHQAQPTGQHLQP